MDELRGKRIVILGLARQGTALARFAASVGAQVVVSDLRSAEAMQEEVEALKDLEITYVFGEHPMSLLDGTDVLAVSGGVPTDAPLVAAARRQGLRITNDSLEFLKRCPAPTIGITGSAGKTTTAALAGAMGRKWGKKTWVGGNIGRPLISDVREMTPGDFIVQELSSFQLELWSPEWGHEKMVSPDVAAILNVTPNHLDRHKSMENYAAAKANVLRFQEQQDVAVLCADDAGAMALQSDVRGRLRTYSLQKVVEDGAYIGAGQVRLRDDGGETVVCHVGEVRLRGEHNLLNVLAAVTLADAVGVNPAAMREAIVTFEGMPHRLELVASVKGVHYVNDSIATAPERALAAINAFDEPLVLLAGGRDKEMVWHHWAQRVAERVRHVVLFGELAPTLEAHLRARGKDRPDFTRVSTLEEAVPAAAHIAQAGDVVLMAPGGTSYDAFTDFEERGLRFQELVAAL